VTAHGFGTVEAISSCRCGMTFAASSEAAALAELYEHLDLVDTLFDDDMIRARARHAKR
jgi:hypothetical protein